MDFGRGIGEKWTWLYNLPEVASTHEFCRVPSVSARFGTDPPLWNWAMLAVARLFPKDFLKDRSKCALVQCSRSQLHLQSFISPSRKGCIDVVFYCLETGMSGRMLAI